MWSYTGFGTLTWWRHGNAFRITDHLRGESIYHRWVPLTNAKTFKKKRFDAIFAVGVDELLTKHINIAGDLSDYAAHVTSLQWMKSEILHQILHTSAYGILSHWSRSRLSSLHR